MENKHIHSLKLFLPKKLDYLKQYSNLNNFTMKIFILIYFFPTYHIFLKSGQLYLYVLVYWKLNFL